jgi:hypothetical protein
MSTFKHLQPGRRPLPSIFTAPTSSFLRPSRPFAFVPPLPVSATQQVSPVTQGQLERAIHAGHSFATIPLFPTVQRKAVFPSPLPEAMQLQSRIQAARSNGHSLDTQARHRLEQGLGTNLSAVRVHTDSEADRLARSVNSLAFTTGPDIFFRSGMYSPSTQEGMHLLAHESTHTIQQTAEPVSGTHRVGDVLVSDPDDHFEQAADKSAANFLARQHSTHVQHQLAAPSISPFIRNRPGEERVRPSQSMKHGTPVIQRVQALKGSTHVAPELGDANDIITKLNLYRALAPRREDTIGIAHRKDITGAGALWVGAVPNPNRRYLAPEDKGKPRGYQANFIEKAAAAGWVNPDYNLHVSSRD